MAVTKQQADTLSADLARIETLMARFLESTRDLRVRLAAVERAAKPKGGAS
jgi:hypothetical protein